MNEFPDDVLEAVKNEREVYLTTYGRKSGKASTVTIWIVTDGHKVFIRSGQGLARHWPKNLLERPEGTLKLDGKVVPFKSRHVTDPTEARHSSKLYGPKYGAFVETPGERPDRRAKFQVTSSPGNPPMANLNAEPQQCKSLPAGDVVTYQSPIQATV